MRKLSILYSVTSLMFLAVLTMAGCSGSSGAGNNSGAAQVVKPITTPSADGNLQAAIGKVAINSPPVVTFALSDETGQPLDPATFIKGGGVIRFFISRINADGSRYDSYLRTNDKTSLDDQVIPSFDGNEEATSAAGAEGAAAYAARFSTVSPGVYAYAFKTDIKDPSKTLKGLAFDPSLTHTVVALIYRDVTSNGHALQQSINPYLNFRPDGETVSTTREIVAISACNECHGKLGTHTGSRREIMLCVMCHNSDIISARNGAPIDLKSLIHKIHSGRTLPSASKGVKYGLQTSDFSKVRYPLFSNDVVIAGTPVDCTKCHKQGTDTFGRNFGKNVDRWKTTPSRANCGSCHDLTVFDAANTSLTFNTWSSGRNTTVTKTVTGTMHSGGAQADDSRCASCHSAADNEYDYSVAGAHTVFEKSAKNPGFITKILSVSNLGYAKPLAVRFQFTDFNGNPFVFKNTSSAVNLKIVVGRKGANGELPLEFDNLPQPTSEVRAFGNYTALFFTSNGAAASKDIAGKAPSPSTSSASSWGHVPFDPQTGIGTFDFATYTEDSGGRQLVTPAKTGNYQFGAVIGLFISPNRNDVTVSHRGRTPRAVQIGTPSDPVFFDLDTGNQIAPPRKPTVELAKCNACHGSLAGGAGISASDIASLNLPYLSGTLVGPGFHKSQRAKVELCVLCHTPNNGLSPGTGSRKNDYAASGDIKVFIHKLHRGPALADKKYNFYSYDPAPGYPNDLRNCQACHTTANPAMRVTIGSVLNGAPVTAFAQYQDPSRLSSWRAVCTSCHDNNTSMSSYLENQCSLCHNDPARAISHTPSR